MIKLTLPIVVVTAALALGGCYGAPASPSETPTPTASATAPVLATGEPSASAEPAAADLAYADACATLDPDTIASAAGGTWGDGAVNTDLSTEYQTICEWYHETAQFTFVQVLVTNDPAAVAAQRASANEILGDAADVSVAGATDAYAALNGTIVGMVVGDHFVQVTYAANGDPNAGAVALQLAGSVAAAIG